MTKLPTTTDLHGNVITSNDLPPPNTTRWTANKKAIMVRAVVNDLVTLDEVLERYSMTEREFKFWVEGLAKYGKTGLKITYFQKRKSK